MFSITNFSMKLYLSFFLLALGLCAALGSFAQDTIHWSPGYKLKWEDFKGRPDTTSEFKAITGADLNYILTYNASSFHVQVRCDFIKMRSWTLSNDSIGLVHEQGHFDISEIFARRLRKMFSQYVFDEKSIEMDFKRIFSLIKVERKAFNKKYDRETNYSRDIKKQIYWSRLIQLELNRLDAYK